MSKSILNFFSPFICISIPRISIITRKLLLVFNLKWRQAKHRDFTILPDYHLKFFRILKRVNLFLIGAGFVLLIYESINHSKACYWTLFLYLFALAEYINYYYIRLFYQSVDEMKDFLRHRKLRRSKLAEELKQLKAISQ